MTDNQILFMVVLLLYLSECLFWVGSDGLAFTKSFKEWKVTLPSSLFGNAKGGLALAWPLPFLGKAYLSYFLPLSFSEKGIVNASLEGVGKRTATLLDNPTFILYEEIKNVTYKGGDLIVNGELFCKCGSTGQANALAEFLQNIRCQKERKVTIHNFLKSLFDMNSLRAAHETISQQTKSLVILCNSQFFCLLIIAPILLYFFGTQLLIASFIYIILTNLLIAIFFYLVHRKIYPNQIGERVSDVLKMIFCPPMTIRATDVLTLRYLTAFHPLAVARLVSNDVKFELLAKQMLLSFNYPSDTIDDNEYKHDMLWHLKAMEESVYNFLNENGISASFLTVVPKQVNGVVSYCPRCHTQYTVKDGQCLECSGVTLIEYTGKNNG